MTIAIQTLKNEPDPKKAHQIKLEELYSKNQTLRRIRYEFDKANELGRFFLDDLMEKHKIDRELGYTLLVQMVLHKRCKLPAMVGILRRCFEGEVGASQKAADQILLCAQADLVDWSDVRDELIIKHDISPDVQDELDRYQFPLPMIVEPRMLRDNRSCAYLAVSDGSVILRGNHHDGDVCLDHLNRANRIRFTLNTEVTRMVRNQWRNLDKVKPGETKADLEKRQRAFEKYDRTAHRVMAQVQSFGDEFYLTHKYDKRGRVYCQGYHVNYQGNAWNKAVVELADKEIIP